MNQQFSPCLLLTPMAVLQDTPQFSLFHHPKRMPSSSFACTLSLRLDPKSFLPFGLISSLSIYPLCASFSFGLKCSCFPPFCYLNSIPSFKAYPLFHYFMKLFLILMLNYSLLLSLHWFRLQLIISFILPGIKSSLFSP